MNSCKTLKIAIMYDNGIELANNAYAGFGFTIQWFNAVIPRET
jgi:hypothetical protein